MDSSFAPQTTLEPTLNGKYRLGRVLGSGGMGTVNEAQHLALGERVAIKFLKPEYTRSPEIIERFLREARSLFRIKSEHVVRVLDVDAPEGAAPYLVMEFLEGAALDDVLDRRQRLGVHEAVEIVRQVCEGLAEAHRLGIVHRDVKPHNVMITARPDGSACAKLLDFGIAQIGVFDGIETRLTVTEAIIGTPSYMSPEQLRSARAVDARSDVWSLGVLFFELLTGDLPWSAASPGDLVFRQYTEAVPLEAFGDGVPREIAEIAVRCLAIEPSLRFQDATELADALAPHATDLAAAALLVPGQTNAPRPARRTPRPRPTPMNAPDAMTFARRKVYTTNGGTAFERHELVPRSSTPESAVPSSLFPSAATVPPRAQSVSDRTLFLGIVGGVGGVVLLLGLLLVIVALRGNGSEEPKAAVATTPRTNTTAPPPPPSTLVVAPKTAAPPASTAIAPSATTTWTPKLPKATKTAATASNAAPNAPKPASTSSPSLYTDKW